MSEKKIWTLKQFCSFYAWPTYSGMWALRSDMKENGFEEAFLKCGRRVLVDVDKFWEILQAKQKRKE